MNDEIKKALIFGAVKSKHFEAVQDVILNGVSRYAAEKKYGLTGNTLALPVKNALKKIAEYKCDSINARIDSRIAELISESAEQARGQTVEVKRSLGLQLAAAIKELELLKSW